MAVRLHYAGGPGDGKPISSGGKSTDPPNLVFTEAHEGHEDFLLQTAAGKLSSWPLMKVQQRALFGEQKATKLTKTFAFKRSPQNKLR